MSAVTDLPPLPPGCRYQLLRFHAEGGLGRVYVGRDAELGREVAVKLVQPEWVRHGGAVGRFKREAEITGRLEHPAVVPVYGLLPLPDGSFCYAMRFLQGRTLAEAIADFHAGPADPRERRRLLGHFVAVCRAVEFAHSRNIIHRDLKPSNVMLGAFGETWVLDWGLAKQLGDGPPAPRPDGAGTSTLAPVGKQASTLVVGPAGSLPAGTQLGEPADPTDESATTAGQVFGTPSHLPPEQARGEPTGPPADVWALGAALYHLLTGSPPYPQEKVEDRLTAARANRFVPVRAVNPSASRALAAVSAKAMAARPEDRYPSVAALAADVEHWLADEPVSAMPEPAWDRFRRWARRNRASVIGGMSAAAVGLAATAVGLAAVAGKNRQLDAANTDLEARNEALAAAVRATDEQRIQLREMAADMLRSVQETAATRDGVRGMRGRVLSAAEKGLDGLTADPKSAVLRAQVHIQRAYDLQSLTPSQTVAARGELEAAVRLLAPLAADRSDARARLADARLDLVFVRYRTDGVAAAAAEADRPEADAAAWVAAAPTDLQAKAAAAQAAAARSFVARQGADLPAADAASRRALDLRAELADARPGELDPLFDWATAVTDRCGLLLAAGRTAEAAATATAAVTRLEAAVPAAADRTAPRYANTATLLNYALGDGHLMAGRMTDAAAYYQLGLDAAAEMEQANPGQVFPAATAADVTQRLGYCRWLVGRSADALRAAGQAFERYNRLAEAEPTNPVYQFGKAQCMLVGMNVFLQTGEPDQVEVMARGAAEAVEAALAGTPDNPAMRLELANRLYGRVLSAHFAGRRDEAVKYARQGQELVRKTRAAGGPLDAVSRSVELTLDMKVAALTGDRAGCLKAADALAATPGTGWYAPFYAACGYAAAAGLAPAEADRYAALAAAQLRAAAANGLLNPEFVRRVPDLAPVLARPEVQAAIAAMQLPPNEPAPMPRRGK